MDISMETPKISLETPIFSFKTPGVSLDNLTFRGSPMKSLGYTTKIWQYGWKGKVSMAGRREGISMFVSVG